MKSLKNFWIQPSKGFTEKNKGVSDEQFQKKEQELGYKFPERYRDLMKLQNGGYLRKHIINDQIDIESFESLKNVESFLEYLYITKSDEDLEEMYNQYEFCNPKRLISFASLYGHGVVCFDYGWLKKDRLNEPKIILIEDDGDDFLDYGIVAEYKNFDAFLSQFKHEFGGRYWSETTLIIESELGFENFIVALRKIWNQDFEVKEDDRYGWFNFEKYYYGTVPLVMDDKTISLYVAKSGALASEMSDWIEKEGKKRLIKSVFSPNKHISGTYLFPENTTANIIIEVKNSWFPKKYAIENLKDELKLNLDLKIKKITMHNNK